mmetsp:Transcript_25135/g.42042  ORF Transcript_25135/g.42042 Transcript_25135/m.42042 type:complete len:182 (+) Transcript_25135:196-741(+)
MPAWSQTAACRHEKDLQALMRRVELGCHGGRTDGVEHALHEALRILGLLEDEAELMPPSQRPDVIAYKMKLQQMQRKLQTTNCPPTSGANTQQGGGGMAQRLLTGNDERCAQNINRNRNADRLRQTIQLSNDAEVTGLDILSNLQSQRETLTRARNSQREMTESLSGSEKLLKAMGSWFRF